MKLKRKLSQPCWLEVKHSVLDTSFFTSPFTSFFYFLFYFLFYFPFYFLL